MATQPTVNPLSPSRPRLVQVDPRKRYAVAGARSTLGLGSRVVQYGDHAMRHFGPEVYERMDRDPAMAAARRRVIYGVLGEDLICRAASTSEDRAELAETIRAAAERSWRRIDGIASVAAQLHESMKRGNSAAETTLESGSGPDRKLYVFESYAVLDRRSVGYALDDYGRLLGLIASSPGAGQLAIGPMIFSDAEIVPKSKFGILTLGGDGISPLGESMYAASVGPWQVKQIEIAEAVRFSRKRASPPLIAKAAPGADDEDPIDENTGMPISGAEPVAASVAIAQKAAQLESFGVIGIDSEADISALDVKGNDQVYHRLLDWCDRQMTLPILLGFLGMLEAEHDTRAAASVHDLGTDLAIAWLKRCICRMLADGPFRMFVVANWGQANADLVPTLSLGDTERKDWTKVAAVATALLNLLLAHGYRQAADDLISSMGFSVEREETAEAVAPDGGEPEDPDADPDEEDAE